ncbi:MAG: hypothetical protein L6Q66_00090 [Bacteroidia bacterium]|nr:hypothetical protein [Bacteroidia bacterium]
MKNYRKTDHEYIEDYDKQTIRILKELETELGDKIYTKSGIQDIKGNVSFKYDIPTKNYDVLSRYYRTAVMRAQNKESYILQQKYTDENKDRLIAETPIPRNIKCDQCGTSMIHEGHIFEENDTLLLFVFSCPNKHTPKKILYPDGIRKRIIPVSKCEECGGKLSSVKEETKTFMKFIDTCLECGHVSIMEFNLTPDLPITEEDRKIYCEIWKGKTTFEQDLEAVVEFANYYNEKQKLKKEKEELKVDNVEQVNLPKLEDRLFKLAEELGYTKFKFDSHSTERFLTVSFSLQDPSDRTEKESCKVITDAIKQSLFTTNWRLFTEGIDYRLGLLSGRLRAYEGEEGLMKIAREIYEQKENKK